MGRADKWSSCFWLLIGLYICIHASLLGFGNFHSPGPGFIFFLAGALLSILSVMNFLLSLSRKGKENESLKILWSGLRWQKVIIVLIFLSAWTYFFDMVGFFLSTFLFLLCSFRIVEPTKWWVAALIAFITVFASYGFFSLWLKVPFPKGFLGI